MKKILFFIPTLSGGGAEKVLVNLVNNLNKTKFEVTVQTLFDVGINKKYLNSEIKYKYIFKHIFRGNIYFLKMFSPKYLFKKMIKEKYDIIVSYLEGPTTRIVSGCSDNNVKLINWVHTELKELKEFSTTYRSLKELKECYKKYSFTAFISPEAETSFKEKLNINIDSLVIRNIIDSDIIINQSLEKNEDKFFLEDNKIKVITIGRLIHIKGYLRLLEIHKKLIDEGIIHSLYILGDGEEKNKLNQYINDNKLSDSVKLLGYKENPYIYLKNSSIYVCTSYKEGYNTAIIEALLLGKPIVTTNCSGMNDILDNGKYGLIVDNTNEALYDGIKQLLTDRELRKHYEKITSERKKYFEIANTIKDIEKILLE